MENQKEWWSEENGFFGPFYMKADLLRDADANDEKSVADRTQEEVDGIVRLLDLEKGAQILDCPCGYGRHSIELASRGFQVTGVDINEHHLKKARSHDIDGPVSFHRDNMINLDYSPRFDAVINIFESFGFLETEEENEKVLRNFFNALKPGGKFLMHTDTNVPRLESGANIYTNEKKLENGETLKIKDVFDPNTRRINGSWTVTDGDKQETKSYSVRIYSKEEFEGMCKKVGFESVSVFSNWQGEEYSENASNMIVIARK